MVLARLGCLIFGYLFGMIQTAYLYGKMNGIDIREHGSGNAGTTNALRILGKKAGLIVFFGDFFKTVAACTIVRLISNHFFPDYTALFVLYAGFGVILGHSFPAYMNFKGGKGIAATAGLILSILDVRVMVVCAIVFFGIVILTRYVSLGSILLELTLLISYIIVGHLGYFTDVAALAYESYIVLFIIACLTIYRHKTNIVRLLHGNERKLWGDKKEEK